MPPGPLEPLNCRVVLARPQTASNVGAVARAMRNFGLTELVLVAPCAAPDDPRGRLLATHSQDILDRARVVAELGQAVAECGLVAGTSARTGGLFRRQSVGPPEQVMPRLVEAMAVRPAALVFGPEDRGLTNAEVARCHYLIHIPTDPAHAALNLAQAVAICLYELHRCWLQRQPGEGSVPAIASFEEQERMFGRLQEELAHIHFLYGPRGEALMHALRHLIGRAQPTAMEVDLLLGLARQLRWFREQTTPPKTNSS